MAIDIASNELRASSNSPPVRIHVLAAHDDPSVLESLAVYLGTYDSRVAADDVIRPFRAHERLARSHFYAAIARKR